MDNINKIISFVLGLIVVVVFIIIISGKINLGQKLKSLTAKRNVTPTVTPKVSPVPTKVVGNTYKPGTATPTPTKVVARTNTGTYKSTNTPSQIAGSNVSTIPNTGAPTILLPAALAMLAGGSFLRKSGKK